MAGCVAECEGRGTVSDLDLSVIIDESKSLADGAILVPGYTADGWMVTQFVESGFFDPKKPIKDYTDKERNDLLYRQTTKVKARGINITYDGLIPKIRKSMFSKDVDSLQPHIRAFVERAAVFKTCPACDGTRLNEAARPQDRRAQHRRRLRPAGHRRGGLVARHRRQGRGAARRQPAAPPRRVRGDRPGLPLARPPVGHAVRGEAQRTKMVRHIGSALTDVTYVFDEPTVGLHPHDIQRMNDLLLELRDKGNTVLVVEHKPETIAIADHVVDLGPGAGTGGGTVCFEGTVEGLRRPTR